MAVQLRLRGERSSVTYCIKDSADNILMDKNEILSRWRYYFEYLLNPIKASTHYAQEAIHLGEEEVITRAGQVRKLVRKSANPKLRTNEKSCGHADLRTLAV